MKTRPSPCVPAFHTPKMVLQMVLRTERPLDSARNNQDLVQNMVSALSGGGGVGGGCVCVGGIPASLLGLKGGGDL
jgi:hypothetical protein